MSKQQVMTIGSNWLMTVFGFSTEVWDEMDQKLQILGKHNATMAGWWYTYPDGISKLDCAEEENKHLVNVVCGMEEHRNGVSTKKRCQRLDSE